MTPRELIDHLCDLRPEWDARRAEIHDNNYYYSDGASLGCELLTAAVDGIVEPWVGTGFAVIERAITSGDDKTRNLVIAGLFEAMQNDAYRRDVRDEVIDGLLGPASLRAWAALIEGWTGDGVRTLAHWRRVIINGPRDRIAFTSETLQFVANAQTVGWHRGAHSGAWTPTAEDLERIGAPLRPLIAVRHADRVPFGDMQAMIDVDGAQGPALIMIGAAIDGGRIARHGERWYVVDYDALAAAWAWVAER